MANPFLALKRIRQLIDANHTENTLPYGIEEMRAAIVGHTALDYIEFIEFQDPDNPILGRYEKYSVIQPYTAPKTYVEISYASDANVCWQRLTICKEMCHALLNDEAMCVSGAAAAETLINALLSEADTRELLSSVEPFRSEKLAELLALELLCPVEERRRIHDARAAGTLTASDRQLAIEYRIPVVYVPIIFSESYISQIERLLDSAG